MPSTTRHYHRIMALATLLATYSYKCRVAAFMLVPPTAEPFLLSSGRSTTATLLSCAAPFSKEENYSQQLLNVASSAGGSKKRRSETSTTSLHYKNDDNQQQTLITTTTTAETNNKSTTKPPKIHPSSGGRITLVGAGPGSPDLLTMAAHRIITDPNNFIIVDRLVSQEILDLIQGEYKVANKHPGCAELAQQEIYEWCKEGIKNGRHVVRLKIGDPFVFGRGGEEVLEFRAFGVEPSIVPGVSAAFSAPLLGSIPVTHRGVSNQVVMCTGYGREGTSPDLIQYHKEQTVVFLMAVGRLRTLCHNLVTKAHYPMDTPVGIVERAGCPDQRTIVGNMETIADLADSYNVKPPSTIVVGKVVNVLLTEDDFGMEEQRREGLLVQSSAVI